MKTWWARVAVSHDSYGRWIPTGCTDKLEAIDYMATYPGERQVKEWLQL
jgi:hypothetical protein